MNQQWVMLEKVFIFFAQSVFPIFMKLFPLMWGWNLSWKTKDCVSTNRIFQPLIPIVPAKRKQQLFLSFEKELSGGREGLWRMRSSGVSWSVANEEEILEVACWVVVLRLWFLVELEPLSTLVTRDVEAEAEAGSEKVKAVLFLWKRKRKQKRENATASAST